MLRTIKPTVCAQTHLRKCPVFSRNASRTQRPASSTCARPVFLSLNRTLTHACTLQVRTTTTTLGNKEAVNRVPHSMSEALEATGTRKKTERKTELEMIAEAAGGKMRRVTWEKRRRRREGREGRLARPNPEVPADRSQLGPRARAGLVHLRATDLVPLEAAGRARRGAGA